jgi:hypothetical protein
VVVSRRAMMGDIIAENQFPLFQSGRADSGMERASGRSRDLSKAGV